MSYQRISDFPRKNFLPEHPLQDCNLQQCCSAFSQHLSYPFPTSEWMKSLFFLLHSTDGSGPCDWWLKNMKRRRTLKACHSDQCGPYSKSEPKFFKNLLEQLLPCGDNCWAFIATKSSASSIPGLLFESRGGLNLLLEFRLPRKRFESHRDGPGGSPAASRRASASTRTDPELELP